MKPTTSRKPTPSAMAPARMLSAPSSGPTVRSSTTVSGAGRAPARSSTARSVAVCAVKLPLISPAPAGDRLVDHRRGQDLVVQHDGERVADVGGADLGEAARAGAVEGEVDHPARRSGVPRRAARWSGWRHPPRPGGAAPACSFGSFSIGRTTSPGGAGGRVGGLVHQVERHLRRRADQLLDAVRVVHAGQLHDDAVCRPGG